MSEKVYRTAIYARLSRDDGDKAESNSIVSQKALCEEFIAKHDDLKLVETFVDDGYSGVDFERPGFKAMEDAIRKRQIDCLVCKDLSRFTRNYIDGGRYLEKIFPSLGIRFIAVNDGYDTLTGDPSSDSFIIPFKNLINDAYCKDISVKIRSNLEVKRRKGKFVGPYSPYGYQKDPKDKNRLVVDDFSGDIVRQIFSLYKGGMSICRIADHLNQLGILSPMEYKLSSGINYDTKFKTGAYAKWSYTAVKRILTNEVYLGVLVQGKRGTPNHKVHVVQERDKSEWIRVENAHEALVSYDDFMAVKRMLGRDMRMVGEGSEENLFSGFVYCADCGLPMIRKVVPSGKKQYHYYVCSKNKRHEGCKANSISTKRVEDAVKNAIQAQIASALDICESLEYIKSLPTANRKICGFETQMAKLEEEIDRCKRMKLRIYEDLTDGVITKQEYSEFRAQYISAMNEKSAALERVKREMDEQAEFGGPESEWVKLFRQYNGFDKLTRRVLISLVDKVYIHEDHGVEVSFRYGDEFKQAMVFINRNAGQLMQAQ